MSSCNCLISLTFQTKFSISDPIFKNRTFETSDFSDDSSQILMVGNISEDWEQISPVRFLFRKTNEPMLNEWQFDDNQEDPVIQFFSDAFGLVENSEETEKLIMDLIFALTEVLPSFADIGQNEYSKGTEIEIENSISDIKSIVYVYSRGMLFCEEPFDPQGKDWDELMNNFNENDAEWLDKYQFLVVGTI